jgi:hypothetical protein
MSGRGRCTGHVPFECSRLYPNCFAKVHISIPYEKEKSLTWRGWYRVPTTTKQICCMCIRLATSGAVEGTTLPRRNAEGRPFFFWSQMSVFLMWQVHRGSGHRPQSARATAYRDGVSLPRQYLAGRVSSPVRQGWLSEPKTCRSRGGDMQKQQALI